MSKDEIYRAFVKPLGHIAASRARHNFDRDFFAEQSKILDGTKKKLLAAAFEWESTNEGYDYWRDKYNML